MSRNAQVHMHSLTVTPQLTVICFRRPATARLGPLFVVREWYEQKTVERSVGTAMVETKHKKKQNKKTRQAVKQNGAACSPAALLCPVLCPTPRRPPNRDAKVIRQARTVKGQAKPKGPSTEQALRASVRQGRSKTKQKKSKNNKNGRLCLRPCCLFALLHFCAILTATISSLSPCRIAPSDLCWLLQRF